MGGTSLYSLCLLLTLCVQHAVPTCTLPFTGTWVTSNRGTWTVSSSSIQNFKMTVDVSGSSLWTMDCYSTDGTNYVLKSNGIFRPFTTVDTYIYICMSFTSESSTKYLFKVLTSETEVKTSPSVYERAIIKHISVTSVSQSEVCNAVSDLGQERNHVALQSGSETAGAITCPTSIQGTWSYTYTGLSCSDTYLDTCTDKTKFSYNDTVCTDNPMFSSDGTLCCVYSGTSGSDTYVTLYNADSSVANPTSFHFSCMVYTTSGSMVSATVNPEECITGQTSTSLISTYGKTVTYTDISTTPCNPTPTSETDLTWLYILLGVLIFIIIVLIIIILLCIFCRRKRPQKDDEERNITEESDDDKSTEDQKSLQESPKEETKPEEEEDDRASQDSGFIPDKIDKEEEQKHDVLPGSEEKKEEEVRVEGDGQTKEDQERPDTVVSKMSDLGSTLAPSEQVDGPTPLPLEEPTPREEEHNDEQRPEGPSSESGESTEDEEEVQRRIREIGGKKHGPDYVPEGQLSKVLVTRDMHEKKRNKKQKKLGRHVGKSKKKQDKRKKDGGTPDPLEEESLRRNGDGIKAEYMEQYKNKKRIETKLDEEHYWSVDDGLDQFKLEDYDDEFEESFPKEDELNKDEEKMEVENLDNVNDATRANIDGGEKDREKDSGTDSPGLKGTGQRDDDNDANIDSDPDLRDVEDDEVFDEEYVKGTTNLPPGFIRDSEGRIIRVTDGQIISEEEMARYFKKARIRRLFRIQRLKRNKKGRPTGGYIADEFGPETTLTKGEERKEAEGEDGPKPKHPRSSADRLGSSERKQRTSLTKVDNTGGKSVAFNVGKEDEEDIVLFGEDDDDVKRKGRRDVATPSRELLKKRLFKSRKKRDPHLIHVSESEKPRELNDLVKVYGRGVGVGSSIGGPGISGRPPLPPSSLQRNDSTRGSLNPEQLRQFRQGLANDRKFLEQRKGERDALYVREAFTTPNDLEIEEIKMDNEDGKSIDIGDEDEFVLVGDRTQSRPDGYQYSPEPFFTIVRRSGEKLNNEQGTPWCTRHELRHTIPWSLREPTSMTRANTTLNESGESMRLNGASKSADARKRDMDEWRLKILLEELYKDKKYFDHVIDSTERDKDPILDERDLAEHGRGYLLDRAEFWDQQMRDHPIPLPPWCVPSRVNTTLKLESGRGSQTSTVTPPIYRSTPPPNNVPNNSKDSI
ncbi:trichohyalin-like [Saccostrea cucullata]|uniref:trichohyalin-like n=1 Tax=Saccostrea cuccullata TaxID=36930 RepID=UPI002ED5CCD2